MASGVCSDITGAAFTAEIESIAAGGAGVARLEGRAVFIPRTVPGDTVRFRVAADKGKFLRGDLDALLAAGPSRREPPCPHWADCGGCPLQQMTPDAQSEAKRRILLDALARIGKMEPAFPVDPMAAASGEFGYRQRARFQVRESAVGFFAPGTRRLVPLTGCMLVEPPIAEAFAQVRRLLETEAPARRIESVEITSLGPEPGGGAGIFLYPAGARDGRPGPLARRTRRAWEAFSQATGWPLAVQGDRRPEELSGWLSRQEWQTSGGERISLDTSPESFIQPNRKGNEALVSAVLGLAGSPAGPCALDLFCGAGNFTVPLGRRFRKILGVESNPFAVRDAERNCRRAGLGGARFLRREAGSLAPEEVREALAGESPDLVLLDPPRRGALEAVPLVLALRPGRIIYVSCNPATFARDARALDEGGYAVDQALVVPMFPNTAHVETVSSWQRKRTAE